MFFRISEDISQFCAVGFCWT